MLRPLSIVCILRDPLPPQRADVLTLFGAELPRHGIRTSLVGQWGTRAGGPWLAGTLHANGGFGGAWNNLAAPFLDALGLVRAARLARPDCIQVRDKIVAAVPARLAASLLRIPFVYWMSFPIVEGYAARAAPRARARDGAIRLATLHRLRACLTASLLYRFVLPGAAHVFVQSDAMAQRLVRRGIDAGRIGAVPMGVDVALADAVVPADDVRLDGRRVLVYLGSVARSRASVFLFDVVDSLRAGYPDLLLVIAGDAPSAEEARWFRAELARRELGGQVLLTGWLPQPQALAYAARADVGLSPVPRGDLFDVSSPTKLVEYLALGVPAVASDIPDQRYVIEQSGGGRCVPMHVSAFRTAIAALLDDAGLRARCGAHGSAWVRRHRSYAVLGRQVAATYRRLLGAD